MANGNGGVQSGDTVKSAKSHKSQAELEREFSDPEKPTDYEEVWFAGVHCGMFPLRASSSRWMDY